MSPDATQATSTSASSQNSVQPQPSSATPSSPSNTAATGPQSFDLRHITSIANMAPPMKDRTVSASTDRSGRATSAHPLMSVSTPPHRLGSRSPTSIPSSPTSVHSSSSAIFERDIEQPPLHLLSHLPPNPHRTPRSKATEPIEASVPSVLDSAAELLTSTDEIEETYIAVEAPASCASRAASIIGSPIGRGSRSPSPSTSAGGRNRTSMLLNLPSPVQSSIISVPLSPVSASSGSRLGGSPPVAGSPPKGPPPLTTNFCAGSSGGSGYGEFMGPGGFSPITTAASVPLGTSTPSSVGGSSNYESAASSPKTTTVEHPPHTFSVSPVTPTATNTFGNQRRPPSQPSSPLSASHAPLPSQQAYQAQTQTQSQLSSHPPSPSHAAHKRLSFISYSDILASTPVSTLPLSSLTSPGTTEPPPHIPSVSLSVGAVGAGIGSRSVSAAASMAGSARNSLILDGMLGLGSAADVKEPSGGVGDDLGGEWEREGLGRGLEERLEALMAGKA